MAIARSQVRFLVILFAKRVKPLVSFRDENAFRLEAFYFNLLDTNISLVDGRLGRSTHKSAQNAADTGLAGVAAFSSDGISSTLYR